LILFTFQASATLAELHLIRSGSPSPGGEGECTARWFEKAT
jgi:hypothetical protein